MTENNSSRLVPCNNNGGKCKYVNTVDQSPFELDCECALNEDGTSWCPAAQANSIYIYKINLDTASFNAYYKAIKDSYANKCHTSSRSNCYDTPAKILSTQKRASFDSVQRHKFYKAPSCVKAIMGGSSNFISSSLFSIMILVLFYFF